MPTLDPNKKKNPKPIAPSLPMWQVVKWKRFSSLTAENLKQLSNDANVLAAMPMQAEDWNLQLHHLKKIEKKLLLRGGELHPCKSYQFDDVT